MSNSNITENPDNISDRIEKMMEGTLHNILERNSSERFIHIR